MRHLVIALTALALMGAPASAKGSGKAATTHTAKPAKLPSGVSSKAEKGPAGSTDTSPAALFMRLMGSIF